jgi:adenylosuccinate synthase
MNWDSLPQDIIYIIMKIRKKITCGDSAVNKIISVWKCYKTRVLIGRFKMLRYLKDFRQFNPCLKEFLLRSRL